MGGVLIMPLTSWGAGGGAMGTFFFPPKARPNRLQTRQGKKTARWCIVTYIEGESLKPNAVSSDLERFEKDPASRRSVNLLPNGLSYGIVC